MSEERKLHIPAPPPPPAPAHTQGSEEGPASFSEGEAGEEQAACPASDACPGDSRKKRQLPALSRGALAAIGLAVVCLVALGAYLVVGAYHDQRDASENERAITPAPSTETKEAAAEELEVFDVVSAGFAQLAEDKDGIFMRFVQEFIDEYDADAQEHESYSLTDLGITADELAVRLKSGFSCEVTNVDVYGTTAWVDVTVTSRSMTDQADALAASLLSKDVSFDDEDAYKAFLKEAFLDAFRNTDAKTSDVLITIEQTATGAWELSESNIEYVLGAAWCNYA